MLEVILIVTGTVIVVLLIDSFARMISGVRDE